MDGSYFHPSLDNLSKTFRLITYDQRGSGKSKGTLDTLKLTMGKGFRRVTADVGH
jgi:pimeloyl-ACP methyl ester carboxylesterase